MRCNSLPLLWKRTDRQRRKSGCRRSRVQQRCRAQERSQEWHHARRMPSAESSFQTGMRCLFFVTSESFDPADDALLVYGDVQLDGTLEGLLCEVVEVRGQAKWRVSTHKVCHRRLAQALNLLQDADRTRIAHEDVELIELAIDRRLLFVSKHKRVFAVCLDDSCPTRSNRRRPRNRHPGMPSTSWCSRQGG